MHGIEIDDTTAYTNSWAGFMSSPRSAVRPSSMAANTSSSCSASSLRRKANAIATPAIAGRPSHCSTDGPMSVATPCQAPAS